MLEVVPKRESAPRLARENAPGISVAEILCMLCARRSAF
jgi:hypothetical protein